MATIPIWFGYSISCSSFDKCLGYQYQIHLDATSEEISIRKKPPRRKYMSLVSSILLLVASLAVAVQFVRGSRNVPLYLVAACIAIFGSMSVGFVCHYTLLKHSYGLLLHCVNQTINFDRQLTGRPLPCRKKIFVKDVCISVFAGKYNVETN